MRDDPDQFALLTQTSQGFQGRFEGLFIEGAKSFIEKQRVDPHIPACHLRKAQGQGKAHQETFPTRKILRGADLARLVVVDDVGLKT